MEAGRKHRIDRIQYMAQVTLGALALATTQVRLEGSGCRIKDEQRCGGVDAGHPDEFGGALSAHHQGGVERGPGTVRARVSRWTRLASQLIRQTKSTTTMIIRASISSVFIRYHSPSVQ